jgi:hypothetical protein
MAPRDLSRQTIDTADDLDDDLRLRGESHTPFLDFKSKAEVA